MRISDTQRAMLLGASSKKLTAAELGEMVDRPPGPSARAADSLVKQGLFNVVTKNDTKGNPIKRYSRSAAGAAIARTL